jgi:hypothetical protein
MSFQAAEHYAKMHGGIESKRRSDEPWDKK